MRRLQWRPGKPAREDYAAKTGNRVNYQSIGSGGGRPVPWISAPPTSWSLEHGQAHARSLDYVPLPGSLVQRIEVYWKTQFAH